MKEKFAGGKFREIPFAVDIIFAGGKFRENLLHANFFGYYNILTPFFRIEMHNLISYLGVYVFGSAYRELRVYICVHTSLCKYLGPRDVNIVE